MIPDQETSNGLKFQTRIPEMHDSDLPIWHSKFIFFISKWRELNFMIIKTSSALSIRIVG